MMAILEEQINIKLEDITKGDFSTYLEFLNFTAKGNIHRFQYENQMLIYSKNPKTKIAASYDDWALVRRKPKQRTGIHLFQDKYTMSNDCVFCLEDTYGEEFIPDEINEKELMYINSTLDNHKNSYKETVAQETHNYIWNNNVVKNDIDKTFIYEAVLYIIYTKFNISYNFSDEVVHFYNGLQSKERKEILIKNQKYIQFLSHKAIRYVNMVSNNHKKEIQHERYNRTNGQGHVRDVWENTGRASRGRSAVKNIQHDTGGTASGTAADTRRMEGADGGRGSRLSTNTRRDTRQTGNDGNASVGIYESRTASVVTQHGMYGNASSIRTTESKRGFGDDGHVRREQLQGNEERKSQSKLAGELSNATTSKEYNDGGREGRNLDETLYNRGNQPKKSEGEQLSLFKSDNGVENSSLSGLKQEKEQSVVKDKEIQEVIVPFLYHYQPFMPFHAILYHMVQNKDFTVYEKITYISTILKGLNPSIFYNTNNGMSNIVFESNNIQISYINKKEGRIAEGIHYADFYHVLENVVLDERFCKIEDRILDVQSFVNYFKQNPIITKYIQECITRTANKDKEQEQTQHEEQPQSKEQIQQAVSDSNFHYDIATIEKGGAKTRYGWNIAAIWTLKQIETENRTATIEEQKILSKYVGWGGLSQVFDSDNERWNKEYKELKNLLTKEEYDAARATVNNAFYTAPEIALAINQALVQFGLRRGNILEPSMGIGSFFGNMPKELSESSLYGV